MMKLAEEENLSVNEQAAATEEASALISKDHLGERARRGEGPSLNALWQKWQMSSQTRYTGCRVNAEGYVMAASPMKPFRVFLRSE